MTTLSSSPKLDEIVKLPSSSLSTGVINGKCDANKDNTNYDINLNVNTACVTEPHNISLEVSQQESHTRILVNFT